MSRAVIIPYKFRSRLSELMSEKGINQKELAKEVFCSRKTINEYLNGKSVPTKESLDFIASYFHVFPEYLSGESKYRNAGDMADKKLSVEEKESLIRHIEMMRYFNKEFGLDNYDHGETVILESHTETEIIDGKEVYVQCVDDFENDYSKMLKDIEEYVSFKTKKFKENHAKIPPVKKTNKARVNTK